MKLTLVCNARLPSEKAHPFQVVQMWKAFSEIEDQVSLVYPFRFQLNDDLKPFRSKFWSYYGFSKPFGPYHCLPTFDIVHVLKVWPGFVKIYSRLQQLSFSLALTSWFLPWRRRQTCVWSREILSLPFLKLYPDLPVFYEMHRFPGSHVQRQLSWLQATRGIICLTEIMRQKLVESGYPSEKILVAPDGYQAESFENPLSRLEARQKLNLSQDRPMIVYTGHLYPWKGVETVIQAMEFCPKFDFHIVGGMQEDVVALQKRYQPWPANVFLHGHRLSREIPLWLWAADLVVVPNTAQSSLSRDYTSPLKLFEAMASGTPLLVSDLPSLREVLDETCASFVAPDDPRAWAQAFEGAFCDLEKLVPRAHQAKEKVKEFTWLNRAQRICEFMKNQISR